MQSIKMIKVATNIFKYVFGVLASISKSYIQWQHAPSYLVSSTTECWTLYIMLFITAYNYLDISVGRMLSVRLVDKADC